MNRDLFARIQLHQKAYLNIFLLLIKRFDKMTNALYSIQDLFVALIHILVCTSLQSQGISFMQVDDQNRQSNSTAREKGEEHINAFSQI